MCDKIITRVKNEADYMIKTGYTIREIAKIFKISKSSVHKDLNERLIEIDQDRRKKVSRILQYHTDIRHIRGGVSTKLKYLAKKTNEKR